MKPWLERPPYWSKDHVLKRLGEGVGILNICGEAEKDGDAAALTLRRDVEKWRESDPEFRAQFVALMEKNLGARKYNGVYVKMTEEKVERFFELMEEFDGSAAKACEALGISPATVYGRLSPSSKLYDPAFADRFHVLEALRLAEHREKMMDMPEKAALAGDLKTEFNARKFILSTGLPHLHSEKHQLQITGSVEHRHSLPGVAELVKLSAHASKAPERLPSGDVVEAEVVQ
jgi:hypothetical protein